jgi:hypothetical protein
MTADKKLLLPIERIERLILLIRGQKVMLDADLAELYGVRPQQSLPTQSGPISRRFRVSINGKRVRRLEAPNWHLKMGWTALSPLRLY